MLGEASAPPGGMTGPLRCPRDASPLLGEARAGLHLDTCVLCGGTWFDATELAGLVGYGTEARAAGTPNWAPPSPFRCPRCGDVCREAYVGDVAVDACTACGGVWLDRFELEELLREAQRSSVFAP